VHIVFIDTATSVFEVIQTGFQWIMDNGQMILGIIGGVVATFASFTILQTIAGFIGTAIAAFGALQTAFATAALAGTTVSTALGAIVATIFSGPFLLILAGITAAAAAVYAASDGIMSFFGGAKDWLFSLFDSSEEVAVNNNEMLKKQTAVVEENLKLQQQRNNIDKTTSEQKIAVNISPANVILDNQKVGQIMFNEVTNPSRGRYLDSSVIRDRSGAPTDLTPVVGNFAT